MKKNLMAFVTFVTIPAVKLSTVGSRVFSVAGLRVSNTLSEETTSAPSMTIFNVNV